MVLILKMVKCCNNFLSLYDFSLENKDLCLVRKDLALFTLIMD